MNFAAFTRHSQLPRLIGALVGSALDKDEATQANGWKAAGSRIA